ncbi:hypothetical protein T10_6828 [Trichinella papuae]|uniref:Uncharacterized protein n=1 Tax=Trichinella papuae TaxID=268474 RepID=A0A0V1LYF9_9BILA|nr:hypothetical protein T10_6828 [Trichinella papuae]
MNVSPPLLVAYFPRYLKLCKPKLAKMGINRSETICQVQ